MTDVPRLGPKAPSAHKIRTVGEVRRGLETLCGRKLAPALFSGSTLVDAAGGVRVDDAQSAASFLKGLIEAGAFETGVSLPADDLAEIFGLNRNTVAKGLGFLVAEGYLQRRQGRPGRVVSTRAVFPTPAQRAEMISHTAIARAHGLAMASDLITCEERALGEVHAWRRERVRTHLELKSDDEPVLVLSRIRKIRSDGGARWVPAIAETVYFAVDRFPRSFFERLKRREVESIREFLTAAKIEMANSKYRIRLSPLPDYFVRHWAACSGKGVEPVRRLRFLRFESTGYCHTAPLHYSIAYFQGDLFAFSATDIALEIRPDELARTGAGRGGVTPIRRAPRRGVGR